MNSKDENGNVAIYPLLMPNSFLLCCCCWLFEFPQPPVADHLYLCKQSIPAWTSRAVTETEQPLGPPLFIILWSLYRLLGTVEVQLSFARAAYKAPLFHGGSKSSDCTADFWYWKFLEDSGLPPRSPEIEKRNLMEIEVIIRLTGFQVKVEFEYSELLLC